MRGQALLEQSLWTQGSCIIAGMSVPACPTSAVSDNAAPAISAELWQPNSFLVPAGHEESGAREAWTQFTILSLVAFARHFFKAIASIAEQIETDVFGEALPLKKATRKAVIDCLHI